jgi:preprotein translocase subunit YajC
MNIMITFIVVFFIISICIIVYIIKKDVEQFYKLKKFRENLKIGGLVRVIPSTQSTAFAKITKIEEQTDMVVLEIIVTKDKIYPQ